MNPGRKIFDKKVNKYTGNTVEENKGRKEFKNKNASETLVGGWFLLYV